jgi:S-adenosylmethionine:tRNA ribosyltransferase-isomerase
MKTNMNISDFDYDLPDELIADRPAATRGESKLLVYDGEMSDCSFPEIVTHLRKNDLLIMNDTKVIPARLAAKKETGGHSEVLLVSPISHGGDYEMAMQATGYCEWKCIVSGKNIRAGHILSLALPHHDFKAEILTKDGMYGKIGFHYSTTKSLITILREVGAMPLPPYIKRESDSQDAEDYQTVVARNDGSIAAPTASLHFTDSILANLRDSGVNVSELTLHVGPGTFVPVSVDNPKDHEMHSERILFSVDLLRTIYAAIENGNRIIASGTTALRSLETIASLAILSSLGKSVACDENTVIQLPQFPFEDIGVATPKTENEYREKLLEGLKQMIANGADFEVDSKIMIMPGYRFFIADGLITNFHLPKSTLLLLVSAFIGKDEMWQIYEHAKASGYRFLSYGDSSLLLRKK